MTEEDDKKNFLRIESPKFSLELEGDPAFILETYDTVREDILRRLVDLMQEDVDLDDPNARTQVTAVLPNKPSHGPTLDELASRNKSGRIREANPHAYVWVYITHDIYNKVYVVDVPTWNISPLAKLFDGRRLRKVYVQREAQGMVKQLIGTGKTLWSELTPKGREQLAQNTNK